MDDSMDRRRQPEGDGDTPRSDISGGHLDTETLSAYLDDAMPAAERTRAEAHLAGCEICRADLRELEATRLLLRSLPMPHPRRSFQLTPEHIRENRPWWQRWGAALLPQLPALRAATVAVAILLVAVTAVDLVRDSDTSQEAPPASFATTAAPRELHTVVGETGGPGGAPTETSAAFAAPDEDSEAMAPALGRETTGAGSQALDSGASVASEPFAGEDADTSAELVDGEAPISALDQTAVAGAVETVQRDEALVAANETAKSTLGEAAAEMEAMDAVESASPSGAMPTGAQFEAAYAETEEGVAGTAEAGSLALAQVSATPASSGPIGEAVTATPDASEAHGAQGDDGTSLWRIAQYVLAALLALLVLALIGLHRLRARGGA